MTNLPAGITRLKQLACLDVSGCPLTFLPSQLWKLAGLRHLRLNGAGVAAPDSILSWLPGGECAAGACLSRAGLSEPDAIHCSFTLGSFALVRGAGTCLMVGLSHTWEPLAKLPALESLELRCAGRGGGRAGARALGTARCGLTHASATLPSAAATSRRPRCRPR